MHTAYRGSFSVETVGERLPRWDAAVGEELPCRRDVGNSHDPYAVAMVRASTTVGHVPRRISSIFSIFLRQWTGGLLDSPFSTLVKKLYRDIA